MDQIAILGLLNLERATLKSSDMISFFFFLAKHYPFRVNFHSDGFEMATAALDEAGGGVGFKITYFQTACWA